MDFNFGNIKGFSATTYLQLMFGTIVSGFIFLFVYERELFFKLDIIRLIILSISISALLLTINGMILNLRLPRHDPGDDESYHNRFMGSIYLNSFTVTIVIYTSIILGYLFNYDLKQGLIALFIAELLMIVFILLATVGLQNDKK